MRWGVHQCTHNESQANGQGSDVGNKAETLASRKRDKGKAKLDGGETDDEVEAATRWERGASSSTPHETTRAVDSRKPNEELSGINNALRTRLLSDFIPFIRYPLMDYAFLCGAHLSPVCVCVRE
jgi:hypothetical protein